MLIDVAASPGQAGEPAPITVVVDTLRAATTLTALHERGVHQVWIAETIAEARSVKRQHPDALLCGEEGGLKPQGFDYGNSPVEFSTLDLMGQTVVLATSNGTPLLKRYAAADVLVVGCLRNAAAVADAAAGPDRPILIACAGRFAAGEPIPEDTFTAGAIVNHLIRVHEGFELREGAQEAFEVFLSLEGEPAKAFAASPHAEHLRSLGFEDDLAFCSELNASTVVPLVEVSGQRLRSVPLRS